MIPVYLSTVFTASRTSASPNPPDAEGLADLLVEVVDAHYPVDHEDTVVEPVDLGAVVILRYSAPTLVSGERQAQHATTIPRGWEISALTSVVPDED